MISMQGLILILVIVLIVFGPGKLPDVGKAIGRGIQEFRKASNDLTSLEKDPNKIESAKVIDTTVVDAKTPDKQPAEK
ncbi:MAG: twin-arginine translocase TatA/TatE family subunit [Sporomusaceae bacterium]|jgi:sec-independent protein translocase protein TatA|nr:twin-arginine translocase TatA/TatE family subunit [Sporomusaceae bacterium]